MYVRALCGCHLLPYMRQHVLVITRAQKQTSASKYRYIFPFFYTLGREFPMRGGPGSSRTRLYECLNARSWRHIRKNEKDFNEFLFSKLRCAAERGAKKNGEWREPQDEWNRFREMNETAIILILLMR